MTNSTIEEPPEKIVTTKKVDVEIKEIKVKGFNWKYLKRFFDGQVALKDDWGAAMDLMNNECENVNSRSDKSSNGLIQNAKKIIDTYGEGKYKSKSGNVGALLDKISGSMWIPKEDGQLPKHTDFCPEIKKAHENMDKILASLKKIE